MQLPTLWFSVLMSGVLFDHFIFKSRRFTHRTKTIFFALVIGVVVGTWWFFRDCAWGIEGPAAQSMKGRKWRKVGSRASTWIPIRPADLPFSSTELEHLRLGGRTRNRGFFPRSVRTGRREPSRSFFSLASQHFWASAQRQQQPSNVDLRKTLHSALREEGSLVTALPLREPQPGWSTSSSPGRALVPRALL